MRENWERLVLEDDEAWAKLEGIIAEEHAGHNPSTFGNAWLVGNLLE